MKQEGGLRNGLKAVRTRLGLSQQELASAAGVARQTVGGIEAELYAPSAAVALRLARTLGCRVEELFWLEDNAPDLQARLAHPARQAQASGEVANASQPNMDDGAASACQTERPHGENGDVKTEHAIGRVLLGRVGTEWIAHELTGEAAFRTEMVPADGMAAFHKAEKPEWNKKDAGSDKQDAVGSAENAEDDNGKIGGERRTVAVRILDEPENLARTILLAGCAPSLSLWARSAERWHPGLRVGWMLANSTDALERLARGEVHAAGVHLSDPRTGTDNAPFVRRLCPNRDVVLVNLGAWEEGLIVAAGNPKTIRGVSDLARPDVMLINRETGAGSRLLLDGLLDAEMIPASSVSGYGCVVTNHVDVARTIASGQADAGVSVASVAHAFNLNFVPLRTVRYDLAIGRETMDFEPVRQLLDTLHHRWVVSQLKALGGYDTTRTGEITPVV